MAGQTDVKIRLALDGAGQVQAGVQGVGQALGASADQALKLETASAQLAVTQQRLEAATTKAAAAQAAFAKAAADSSTSQEQLARLQQQAASAAANQQLAAAKASESVQALQKLQAAHMGVTQATKLTGNQTAQLSAQLQDLFVQIQAGGSPMTALIQQGSQLSAVFGGVGNALRAVGTLITPAAVAVGSLAAVAVAGAVAYGQISKEQEAFRKGLILTGNAAGVTVGQLNDMARAQAAVIGSQGKNAEVLAALVATGNVARTQLSGATEAAIRMDRVGGAAIESTLKKFDDLGKSPLDALSKINDAERFLTKGIVDQVAALEAQGRSQEAAAIAQDAYARSTNQRAKELEQSLGLMERGWLRVTDAAKGAWNAMLNVGRPVGTGDQIKALEQREQELQRLSGGRFGRTGANELELSNVRQQIESLKEIARLEQRSAEEQQRRAQAGQIAARWAAEEVKLLSPKKQLELEIQRIEREGLQIGASREERELRIAEARKRFTDKDAAKAIEQEAEALEKAVGLSGRYYKDLAERYKLLKEGKLSQDAYVASVIKLTEAQQFATDLTKAEEAAWKSSDATLSDLAKQRQTYLNDLNRSADAVLSEVTSLQLEEQALALSARKHISLAQAVQEVAIARLEEQRIAASNANDALAQDALQREIDKRRELIGLIGSKEAREANKRSAEEMAREWERVANQVGQSLSDAIMQGGRSARDYLKGLFRQLVLRPLLQPLVQPIANLVAYASGASGTAGALGTAGGTAQGFQGLSNIYSMGSGIYSAARGYSSGLAGLTSALGIGNTAGAATGSLAYANAVGAAGGDSLGAFIAANGNWSGVAAGSSLGAAPAGTGVAAGSGSSAGTASLGAYWPLAVIAGMVASSKLYDQGWSDKTLGNNPLNWTAKVETALAKAIGVDSKTANILFGAPLQAKLFGRQAPTLESQELIGSFANGNFSGNIANNIIEKGGIFRSDKRYTQTNAVTGDLDKALDEGGKSLAELAKKYGEALGLPATRLAEVNQDIRVKLTNDAEKNAQAIQDALKQYGEALLGSFAPDVEPLRKSGESVAQVIERVGANLLNVNAVFKQLDLGLLATSVSGGKAASELLDLFGGIDTLNQSAATYYQAYYSEAERAQKATTQLTEALASVGVSLPNSRKEYRKLVEAQDLNTEAGRRAFQVLLSMAGAFDAITTAGEQAAEKLAEQQAKTAQERLGLEERLLQVQGKTVELRKREREALDATNRALHDQISAFEDFNTAVEKLRSAAETAMSAVERAVSAQQQSLQKAYDAQIKSLDAQAKAINSAFDATAKQVAQQREQAQAAYNSQTTGIRAALQALEATEKTRASEYRTAVDAVATERKAAQAAYVQASTRLQDTIRTTGETVARLRGLNDSLKSTISALRPLGSEATDRARAQTQIRDALALARSGGALPDAENLRDALAAISKPSEDLFASFQDYARDFFRTSVDLRDLQKISGSQLDQAQAQLDATTSLKDALDAANEANLQRLDGIREALDLANEQARAAYDLQRESLQNQLDGARNALDIQLSNLDSVLKNAQDVRDQAIGKIDTQKEALKVQLDADLSALDDILAEAKRQFDAITGVNTSVLSVRDAVRDLNTALQGLAAVTGKPAPTTPGASAGPVKDQWVTSGQFQTYQDSGGAVAVNPVGNTNASNVLVKAADGNVFNAQTAIDTINANISNGTLLADAAKRSGISDGGVDALMGWTPGTFAALTSGAKLKGYSAAEIRAYVNDRLAAGDASSIHAEAVRLGINSRSLDAVMAWEPGTALKEALRLGLPAFAAGGMHAGGARLVGENGPEVAVTGPERIYSFDQLMQMAGGGGRDETLVQEVKALRRELAELRAAQQVATVSAGKTARALERWDQDGMPEVRTL